MNDAFSIACVHLTKASGDNNASDDCGYSMEQIEQIFRVICEREPDEQDRYEGLLKSCWTYLKELDNS